jgi:hypothetical protein
MMFGRSAKVVSFTVAACQYGGPFPVGVVRRVSIYCLSESMNGGP